MQLWGDGAVGWWQWLHWGWLQDLGGEAAVQDKEEGTYLVMFSVAGVKESLFPRSLKHCLSLLWFLRPKKIPKNKFLPPRISCSADLGKKHLGFFFSF